MTFIRKSFRFFRGFGYNNINFERFLSSVPKPCSISDVFSSDQTDEIQVEGWITGVRKMKELVFIDINDGTSPSKLQLMINKNKLINGLNYGSSVKAVGKLNTNKNNQVELLVDSIELIGVCDVESNYPFTTRMLYNPNHEREFLHLRPRTQSFSSFLRLRHKTLLVVNNLLDKENFVNISAPVLTTNDCEDGGEVFKVIPDNKSLIKDMYKNDGSQQKEDEVYFDSKTYLSVSGQLHLEAVARGLKRVYSLGPIFRAENSRSRLHLSEFYMLEAEIAFISDINDIINIIERLLKNITENIMKDCSEEMKLFFKLTKVNESHVNTLDKIINEKFLIITYDEAFDILDKKRDKFKSSLRKNEQFSKEHELYLVEYNNGIPVFVVEWPESIKPFYMKSVNGSDEKVEAVDLLCSNIGELCGGGVREDNYVKLKSKIEKLDFKSKLDWYLQLREYGNVTTGGFGIGFERLLQFLFSVPNIKDTIPFPRWPHHCKM